MLSGNKIAAREKILAQRELAKAELGKLGEKTCLGNYTIGTTDLNQTVSLEDQVKTILGGPAQDRDPAWEAIWENRIKPALLGKTTVTTSTVARERFITLLQERLVELKDEKKCKLSMPQYKGDRSPLNTAAGEITMSALFGKKLEEAYLAAIKEEAATLEFRYAVLINATKSFTGPQLDELLYVWVAGASGSGKSFGAKGVINELLKHMPSHGEQGVNHFMFVDNGVPRQVSQMRQAALTAALVCGYSGMTDLYDKSDALDVKHDLKNAAVISQHVNLIVPETFSDYLVPGALSEVTGFERKPMHGHLTQVFAEVLCPPGEDEKFIKTLVPRLAKDRAYKFIDDVHFTPNNRDLGVESKKPPGENSISLGWNGSAAARAAFLKLVGPRIHLAVINDLEYFFDKKLSKRDIARFMAENAKNPELQFKDWYAAQKELAPPFVVTYRFDVDSLKQSYFQLLRDADRIANVNSIPQLDKPAASPLQSSAGRGSRSESLGLGRGSLTNSGGARLSSGSPAAVRNSSANLPIFRQSMSVISLAPTEEQERNSMIDRLAHFVRGVNAAENGYPRAIVKEMLQQAGQIMMVMMKIDIKKPQDFIAQSGEWFKKFHGSVKLDDDRREGSIVFAKECIRRIIFAEGSVADKVHALGVLQQHVVNFLWPKEAAAATADVTRLLKTIDQQASRLSNPLQQRQEPALRRTPPSPSEASITAIASPVAPRRSPVAPKGASTAAIPSPVAAKRPPASSREASAGTAQSPAAVRQSPPVPRPRPSPQGQVNQAATVPLTSPQREAMPPPGSPQTISLSREAYKKAPSPPVPAERSPSAVVPTTQATAAKLATPSTGGIFAHPAFEAGANKVVPGTVILPAGSGVSSRPPKRPDSQPGDKPHGFPGKK